jgi:hypothetical protein
MPGIGDQVVGALLAVLGVGTSVAGLLGLKFYSSGSGHTDERRRARCWYACAAIWALGQILQFLGVHFATQPVVAAVTSAGILFNDIGASRLFGERLTRWDAMASSGLIFGAILVVIFAPVLLVEHMTMQDVSTRFGSSPAPLAALLGTAAVACAAASFAVVATRKSCRGSTSLGLAFGTLAGFNGSYSITFTKFVWLLFAENIRSGGQDEFAQPAAWILGGFMSGGEALMIVSLAAGLRRSEASVVVPTFYGTMTIFSAVQGLFVFDLARELTPTTTAGFVMGILLCVASLGTLAAARRHAQLARAAPRVDASTLLGAHAATAGVRPDAVGGPGEMVLRSDGALPRRIW